MSAVERGFWLDVAMCVGPAERFIIQLVKLDAAVRRGAETADQMLHPGGLDSGLVRYVVGEDILIVQLLALSG